MINAGLFSSKTPEWETPWDFFRELDREFHFTLDVCATEENRKCISYFDKGTDGLTQEWTGVCWLNPPYGREIGKWIEKAYRSSLKGATVVCLIPSRTDTRYWHDYVMKASEIRYVKGRLYFSEKGPAPFPSAIAVFRSHPHG